MSQITDRLPAAAHSGSRYPVGSAEALLLALPQPVAIVGNGAPARDFGLLIDAYPSVLRLNNYVVDGFEAQVGRRTTLRVTSGWVDIAVRSGVPELTPFAAQRPESSQVEAYVRRGGQPLALPLTDVGALLPSVDKPSTGLALLALMSHLGIAVDVYGFDGFRSAHYWDGCHERSVHGLNERELTLALPGVTLMGPSGDAEADDERRRALSGSNGLTMVRELGLAINGETVLEFGAGSGELSAHLQQQGNHVIAIEASPAAFERIPVVNKLQGDCLDLALLAAHLATPMDRFVAIGTLEELTDNDVRIALRAAARACRGLLVAVSTRAQATHRASRSVQWWLQALDADFVVNAVVPGCTVGQMLFEGYSRRHTGAPTPQVDHCVPALPAPPRLALPAHYVSRERPEYYVDSVANNAHMTWQPDVYPAAAALARTLRCRTLIDIGCGHARKLVPLADEFEIIGVDYGANIAHCRSAYSVGTWLEADFESPLPLPVPASTLAQSVIVCSDVIEHMIDPMALLALLKQMLGHAAAVVLSTPDRARTYGAAHCGPSPNAAHVREWNHDELGRLLEHAGFDVAMLTHTRSNDARPDLATILAVLVNPQHVGVRASMAAPAAAARGAQRTAVDTLMQRPAADMQRAPTLSPESWLAQAQQHHARGEIDEFERAMAQAFALDRRHAPSLRYLASLQLTAGDPSEAAWMYDELLGDGSVDQETIEGTVLAHWRSGDLRTAAMRLLAHG